jgi:formate dehydrogenase subunit gamma
MLFTLQPLTIGSLLMKKRTIGALSNWLALLVCFGLLMTVATPSSGADEAKLPSLVKPLGPANLGADLWAAVRARSDATSDQHGLSRDTKRNKTTQARGYDATVLVNQAGETWMSFRNHQMMPKGRDLMIFVLLLMFLFYVFRGSVGDSTDDSGVELQRFSISARMIHWFLAGLFILLGITGLILLYGRTALIPLVGHEVFAVVAGLSKELHNLSGPLFPLMLILIFLNMVRDNFYERGDLTWIVKGGGFFGGTHPSAGRYNAGEKILFWLTILLGIVISVTGLVLNFPVLAVLVLERYPEFEQYRQVMEAMHAVHGVVAMVFICLIFGHIFLATVVVPGTLSGMTSGKVGVSWARSHHNSWSAQLMEKQGKD